MSESGDGVALSLTVAAIDRVYVTRSGEISTNSQRLKLGKSTSKWAKGCSRVKTSFADYRVFVYYPRLMLFPCYSL